MKQAHSVLLCIIIMLLGSVVAHTASAEPSSMAISSRVPNIRFRTINVHQGLPSDGVRALLQDSFGFIWMGTDNGVTRYDGRSFHKPQHGGDMSVGVLSMIEADSAIWMGTERGIFRYDPISDSVIPLVPRAQNDLTLSATVISLSVDRDGTIWAATYGQGIFSFVPNHPYRLSAGQPAISEVKQYYLEGDGGSIAQIMTDSENQVWAITNWHQQSGLTRLNRQTQQFETITLTDEAKGTSFGSPTGLAMMEDRIGQMWIGSSTQGLLRFDRHTQMASQVLPPSVIGTQHIHSLAEYRPGLMLVGSDDGLLAVDVASGEFRLFREDNSDPNSLSNRFVYPMMCDSEGGLWVGTYYGGVCYASPRIGSFESITGHVISNFCEDPRGRIWIASDDAGLLCIENKAKTLEAAHPYNIKHLLPQSADRGNLNCHALCMRNDELWVGTYSAGIVVLNPDNGHARHYPSLRGKNGEAINSSAYALKNDRSGNLWVGTSDGVCLYDSVADCFQLVRRLGDIVIDIDQDTNGRFWFCTQGRGIWRYTPQTGEWKEYNHKDPNHPRSNIVNCLNIGKDGRIWMGSNDGLCLYNADEDTFNLIEQGMIKGIVADRHLLWLATNDGLRCFDTTGSTPTRHYSEDESIISTSFLSNAAIITRDGRIFMGAAKGFTTFLPYRIQTNLVSPRIVLTDLEVFNQFVSVGSELLPRQLALMHKIDLSYEQNSFSIHFSSLSYASPHRNNYSYRLEGFDKDWIPTTSAIATYTNIPPGEYVLHVRGSNNDGVWCDDDTRLTISVHPPFYWNTAAQIIYLLLFLALVAGIIWGFQLRGERRHAAELKQLADDAEQQMQEARLKFFTTIAHEIRTPVSLIIGPVEQVLRQADQLPTTVRTHLGVVSRNSQRLLDLVNQLLDFRKVEQGTTGYHYQRQPIEPIIRSVVERFVPFVSQQGATIQTFFPSSELWAAVDKEAITKLVSNLMMNAAKYTRTCIWCELQEDSSLHSLPSPAFSIIVRDDGIGMTEEVRRRVFEPFYQANDNKPGTGIGLTIVKNIIDAHNGHIEVKSHPGLGTQFIVTIPLRRPDDEEQPTYTATDTKAGITAQPQETAHTPSSIPALEMNPLDQPTVLIVDDNEELLSFLSSCMSEQYEVLTATNGESALSILHNRQVTLIISDWMMPGMDGGELCRQLRRNPLTSHIPIILLTAKTDDASKVAGMDCGADTYIEKPFSVDYVLACARNLLELRRMLRESFVSHPLAPVSTIASNPTDNDFVERLTSLIEANFDNPDLSVDFLARELYISRSGLFAKIKALSDTTPGEMIQLTRLKKAAQLLSEGKLRISEICYQVGFSSPSYFTKCFTSQFGMKPSEFASQHQSQQHSQ